MGNSNNDHKFRHGQPDAAQLARAGRKPLELAVADYYRRQGYAVTQLPDHGRERDFDGIDLLLRQGDKLFVVACRDRLQPSFHREIQSLQQRLPRLGASMLIIASPGEFDTQARQIADNSQQLQLVDGRLLRVLLGEARMDALQRELAAARAAYPLPATGAAASPKRRPAPGMAIASFALLALVVLLGWLALRHPGEAAREAGGPAEAATAN